MRTIKEKNEFIGLKEAIKIAEKSGNPSKVSTARNNGTYLLTDSKNGTGLVNRYIVGKYFSDIVKAGKNIPAGKFIEAVKDTIDTGIAPKITASIGNIFGVIGKNGEKYNNFPKGGYSYSSIKKNIERGVITAYSARNITDISKYLDISEYKI